MLFLKTLKTVLSVMSFFKNYQWPAEACFQLENYDLQTDIMLIREPIWAHLRERCNYFASMSANAVFSDIFRLNTVGSLLDLSSLKERLRGRPGIQ